MVRKTLADGTVREYRYPPHKAPASRFGAESLGALIQAYKASPEWVNLAEHTRTVYSVYIRDLERDPHTEVARITRRDLLAMRDAIASTRGHGAATGFVRAASAMFTWAVDREWIDHSPMYKVRTRPGGHLATWTAQHVRVALKHLPQPFAHAVFLAAATGQRRGDLLALRWLDYDGAALRFVQIKTRMPMVITLAPIVCEALDIWDRPATTILSNEDGDPWVPQRFTERLSRALGKIPGLPDNLGIHGVRKFRATELAQSGATVHEIAAVTGHRTISMVQLYTQAVDQEALAKRAMRRLPRKGTTGATK